jgi:hypothetical protein
MPSEALMGKGIVRFLFAAIGVGALLPLRADEPAAAKSAALRSPEVPTEFRRLIRIPNFGKKPIAELVQHVKDESGVRIEMDVAGLERVNKQSIDRLRVQSAPFALPAAAYLEWAALQVNGTLQFRGHAARIVPGKADFLKYLSEPSAERLELAKNQLSLEKDIAGAPAKDIIEYFVERWELPILILPGPMNQPPATVLADKQCRLPAETKSLRAWLEFMAKQMGGQVVLKDEAFVIVPKESTKR